MPPLIAPTFVFAEEVLDMQLEPVSGLPSLAELQEKLAGAVTTLLGLQRRLELAEAKASRVVNAVEQERLRGGPSLTEQVGMTYRVQISFVQLSC